MRLTTLRNTGCLLLLLAGLAVGAAAQTGKTKTHVFLFDESGSMEADKRYDRLRDWLVAPLLKCGAFEPGDRVIVRWFSQVTPQTPEGPRYGLKVENKEYSEQVVLGGVPGPGQARGQKTDIPQALELVLGDINERYKIQGDVLIWIVTDNNQDKAGAANSEGSDITPFYEKINERKGKLFRAAYLFPLVREGSTPIRQEENAMIMYLLHYAAQQPTVGAQDVDGFARAAAKNIGNPVIAWFISESSFVPSFEGVSDEDVSFDEGSGVIELKQPLPEGEEGTRAFKFKLKSLARQRQVKGTIAKERLLVSLPGALEESAASAPADAPAEGEPLEGEQPAAAPAGGQGLVEGTAAWPATIFPKELALNPDETSKEFTASLTAPPLRPSGFGGFWAAVFSSTSQPFSGQLQFELSGLQAELQQDDSPLFHVNNTKYIKDIVHKSVEKPRPFSYDVQFVVGYNSGWRRALALGVGALLLALVGGLFAATRSRTRYELRTPDGERELALPLVGQEYILLNGDRAAVISKRFGRLTVAPVGDYTVDGASAPRPLAGGGEEFVIGRDDGGGRQYRYALRRQSRAAAVSVEPDDF